MTGVEAVGSESGGRKQGLRWRARAMEMEIATRDAGGIARETQSEL